MPVTYAERSTTGMLEITGDPIGSPSMWSFYEEHMNIWLGEVCGMTLDPASIISGSGYQDGVYNDVDLVRSASTQKGGKNLKCTVTVTGGGVSAVEITTPGNGFKAGDYIQIPDLAQVGGTGSGFQMQVASGDASIGMIKGPSDKSAPTSYPVALQLGVSRADTYTFGAMFYQTSSTTTKYTYDIYRYDESSPNSNNGYGTWANQENTSTSQWTDSNGDGYLIAVIYCSDPGNQFWFCVDSNYQGGWGVFKAVQDPSGTWADENLVSPWHSAVISNTGFTYRPLIPVIYTTNYTGASRRTLEYPDDIGVLFNEFILRGRAYTTGVTPPGIYMGAGTQPWGHIYQDGADSYRRFTNRVYFKMN